MNHTAIAHRFRPAWRSDRDSGAGLEPGYELAPDQKLVLDLQRRAGNEAVRSLLGRHPPLQRSALLREPARVAQRGSASSSVQRKGRPGRTRLILRDLPGETIEEAATLIEAHRVQEAIDLIVGEVGAAKFPDLNHAMGRRFQFVPGLDSMGKTWCESGLTCGSGEIVVGLGPKAAKGAGSTRVSNLYSTMIHEHEHIHHFLRLQAVVSGIPGVRAEVGPLEEAAEHGVREFLAYQAEIDAASRTGVGKDELRSLGRLLKAKGWDAMSTFDQAIHREDYLRLIYAIKLRTGDFSLQP